MKTLVAVTLFGNGKDYVLPKFREMMEACLLPVPGVRVRIYGDHNVAGPRVGDLSYRFMHSPGPTSEDMLMVTRAMALKDAKEEKYDFLMWQGIDALWQSPFDVYRIICGARYSRGVMTPLIPARKDENYPVHRRFKSGNVSEKYYIPGTTEEQEEISDTELLSEKIIETGFSNADNFVIPRSMFHINWDDHTPWYERVAQGRPNLCAEEYWCLQAIRHYHHIRCDTAVKVWHVDDDDASTARMYKGITTPVDQLHWK